MATQSAYRIESLSPDTWPAFDAMVQRHNGIFGGCWCIWFHPDGPERGQGAEANRALKKSYVDKGAAHAALVMDGDEAIAWAEFGTPVELPTLHHRKQYDATKTDDPDYRITCVFVDSATADRASPNSRSPARSTSSPGPAADSSRATRTTSPTRPRRCRRRSSTTALAGSTNGWDSRTTGRRV